MQRRLLHLCAALLCVTPTATAAQAPSAQSSHPLDPLSWQEHWTVLEVLRDAGRYSTATGVASVSLAEPPKDDVLAWRAGQPFARHALAVLREDGETREAVVDLRARRLLSYTPRPDAQANWLEYEFEAMDADVKQHPEFIEAMRRRGITDFSFIDCGGGPPGHVPPELQGRRIAYVECYDPRQVRNTWTRTITGLTVIYDVDAGVVVRVVDEGAVPIPEASADFDVGTIGPLQPAMPPLVVTQPQGPGYTIDGNTVEWQDWRFHVRPDQRTGMVLSTVTRRDGERMRPVLYQGHLSEIFVPYMDPALAWSSRTFLDLGEYVAGGLTRSMQPGLDCPAYATWLDQIVILDNGRPRDVPRAICIFERITGDVVWRHVDDGRPRRDLVVRMTAVLGNYDYVIDWVFQQDGALRVLVGATGVPAVRATDSTAAYGRAVADGVVAVSHDHYFNFRLDVDVDGPTNRFHADRLEVERLPADHPRRSVWVHRERMVERELDARLDMDMHRPALWRAASSSARNANGYATSYQLVPGHNIHALLDTADVARGRAGFIAHHLWVTPHDPAERFAAGTYPTLSGPGEGLPAWTATNRSIVDTDIVLWYTMGMHHVVRSEDWPVQPVVWHSFELRPFDFHDRNPALRLPRTP